MHAWWFQIAHSSILYKNIFMAAFNIHLLIEKKLNPMR